MEPINSLRPAVWNAGDERDFSSWDQHRDTLRCLYLDEGCSLKTIKHKMEAEHGFPLYRLKDYETVFREHFHFRKNLEQKDWESIAYRIEERRKKGKASVVYLGNKALTNKKVQRGTRQFISTGNNQPKTNLSHPLNPRIRIKTPPPRPADIAGGSATDVQDGSIAPAQVLATLKSTPHSVQPYAAASNHQVADASPQSALHKPLPANAHSETILEYKAIPNNQYGSDAQNYGFQSSAPRITLPGIGSILSKPLDDGQKPSSSRYSEFPTEQSYNHGTGNRKRLITHSTTTRATGVLPLRLSANSSWQTPPTIVNVSMFPEPASALAYVPLDLSSGTVGYLSTTTPSQPLEKLLLVTRSFMQGKFQPGSLASSDIENPALVQKQICEIERWYNDFNPGFDLLGKQKVPEAFRIFQRCFEGTRKIIKPEYPFTMIFVCHQAIRCAYYDRIGRNMSKFLLKHVAELCQVFLGVHHPLSVIADGLARMDIFEFALCIGPFMDHYSDALEPFLEKSEMALGELSGSRGLGISLMEGTGMLGLYEAKPRLDVATRKARERGLSTLHLQIETAAMLQRNKFLNEALAIILELRQSKEGQANPYQFFYSGVILTHIFRSMKNYDGQIRVLYEMVDSLSASSANDDEMQLTFSYKVYMEIRQSSLLLVLGWLMEALRKMGRTDEADRVRIRYDEAVENPI
ncbi:hypothetical protein PFICI_00938 [Pestalotiopsis fici W106-1]|uniref:Clr5 domain-containing protein n=1 Tax=Pestalotiopsis fici (strain W106-1 / CGMCC3.15140) TaxID=1229662 RepID=W3XMB9_PESFW|nr:uncharacterized protein PFICI_00938 [Pestalotiopsis fici W106-1]ETS87110.1 hypothetical protein PFICI_00938 [Pestalotiopsis fici W106-1]